MLAQIIQEEKYAHYAYALKKPFLSVIFIHEISDQIIPALPRVGPVQVDEIVR